MGAEEQDEPAGGMLNPTGEDLLSALPGIGTKNLRYVMSRINSVRELCGMKLDEVQAILGAEPGKRCYDFIHHGEGRTSS